ncbi:hypothetical protein TGAMA5MH_01097 [Trichoderma gamsii]|uniref:Uncharacterized protein n=1 Tax=Trichoderma gamsii TaxID=398673 RepID=A0A2K0TP27_9HYPO|nr:hypothetical protein TGAMA5MH_01097 [Trichoderma gamsii]
MRAEGLGSGLWAWALGAPSRGAGAGAGAAQPSLAGSRFLGTDSLLVGHRSGRDVMDRGSGSSIS